MNKKVFIIDGKHFSNLSEFYDEVQRVLTDNFQEFGRNFDAFNDVLHGGFSKYKYDEQIKLIWKNSRKSRVDLSYPETVVYFQEKLTKVHPANLEQAMQELSQAQIQKGPTLFDTLIDIVHESHNVELIME